MALQPARVDADSAKGRSEARERILESAYELFSRHGIRAVGIDAIVERSGVARMTLYRHFASKDALVLAFLERREQRWVIEWFRREVERRATDPVARLLALGESKAVGGPVRRRLCMRGRHRSGQTRHRHNCAQDQCNKTSAPTHRHPPSTAPPVAGWGVAVA